MTKVYKYNSVHSNVCRPEGDDVMLRRWQASGEERLWCEVTHFVKLFNGEQFGRHILFVTDAKIGRACL